MNFNTKSVCTLPLAYPELRVERQNPKYASLLSLAYAGQNGELNAILNYTYGRLVCEDAYPEMLSDTLRCVSNVEMHHLEMLGKLIVMLGGDPRFSTQNKRMGINTALLPYKTSPSEILSQAISGEKKAIKLYEDLMFSIEDRYVRDVLRRIIKDEEHHLKIFTEMQYVPAPYRR
jgi:bacterioferritin